MKLAKVKGSVTSTMKHQSLEGEKLLVIQPIDGELNNMGTALIALDRAQAGPGDLVIYIDEGNSARMILGDDEAPMRVVIVGIVDEVSQ